VIAYEVEGWTGDELMQLWRDEILDQSVSFATATHKSRHYLITDTEIKAAAYAAGPTFYQIVPYCCVDFSPGAPPPPTSGELIQTLLEHLPNH
jgi:hypothetical protein